MTPRRSPSVCVLVGRRERDGWLYRYGAVAERRPAPETTLGELIGERHADEALAVRGSVA